MLTAMIVDDEPPARRAMRRLLERHGEVKVAAEVASLAGALDAAATCQPDIAFLDIALGEANGFDALKGFSSAAAIVFVTAHSDHALRAFDAGAVDYLLKPVEPARLARSIVRAKAHIAAHAQDAATAIRLKTERGTFFAAPDQIVLVTAEGDFSRVHLSTGETVLIGRLLGRFEADLPAPPFLRIARSIIVNTQAIEGTTAVGHGRKAVLIRGRDAPLPLGRTAQRRLLNALSL